MIYFFKNRSAEVLLGVGVDLMNLLLTDDPDTFNNVLHSFVSIAAVQVALTDVLSSLGIQPDGIIGHSVGEVGCAYADGVFTAEQAVLTAYWRGRAIQESKLNPGAMAAVGRLQKKTPRQQQCRKKFKISKNY